MSAPTKPDSPDGRRYPLTVKNDAYCLYAARRFFIRNKPARLSFGDLVQAARVGMLTAELSFDPDRGVKFCTYAHHAIIQAIHELINNADTAVRIPQGTRRKPPNGGFPARVPMVELDGLSRGTPDTPDPADLLPELQHTDPVPVLIHDVVAGLKPLSEKEVFVLINRAAGRKLNDIGDDLNVSRERIRQIERQALNALTQRRHHLMPHPARARRKTEKRIQSEILREFATKPWCRLWRQNTGRAVPVWAVGRPRPPIIAFGIPGCADLTGILADGRRLEIEVKSPGGQQSQQQRNYEAMIRKFGGVYILARSVDDVWKGLAEYGFDHAAYEAA